jgi:hypothetical protein
MSRDNTSCATGSPTRVIQLFPIRYQDHLLYHYLGGTILALLGDYTRAASFALCALDHDTTSASEPPKEEWLDDSGRGDGRTAQDYTRAASLLETVRLEQFYRRLFLNHPTIPPLVAQVPTGTSN